MAAITTLTTQTGWPRLIRSATPGTANNLQEIQIPAQAVRATIQFESVSGKLSVSGTDGAAIGTDFFLIAADSPFFFDCQFRENGHRTQTFSIYLASATSSANFSVLLEGPIRESF